MGASPQKPHDVERPRGYRRWLLLCGIIVLVGIASFVWIVFKAKRAAACEKAMRPYALPCAQALFLALNSSDSAGAKAFNPECTFEPSDYETTLRMYSHLRICSIGTAGVALKGSRSTVRELSDSEIQVIVQTSRKMPEWILEEYGKLGDGQVPPSLTSLLHEVAREGIAVDSKNASERAAKISLGEERAAEALKDSGPRLWGISELILLQLARIELDMCNSGDLNLAAKAVKWGAAQHLRSSNGLPTKPSLRSWWVLFDTAISPEASAQIAQIRLQYKLDEEMTRSLGPMTTAEKEKPTVEIHVKQGETEQVKGHLHSGVELAYSASYGAEHDAPESIDPSFIFGGGPWDSFSVQIAARDDCPPGTYFFRIAVDAAFETERGQPSKPWHEDQVVKVVVTAR